MVMILIGLCVREIEYQRFYTDRRARLYFYFLSGNDLHSSSVRKFTERRFALWVLECSL